MPNSNPSTYLRKKNLWVVHKSCICMSTMEKHKNNNNHKTSQFLTFTVAISTVLSSPLYPSGALEEFKNMPIYECTLAQTPLHEHVRERLSEKVAVVFSPSCNATQPATINLVSRNVGSQRIPIKSCTVCVCVCVCTITVFVCSRKCYSHQSAVQPIQTCRPNSLPPPSDIQCSQYRAAP